MPTWFAKSERWIWNVPGMPVARWRHSRATRSNQPVTPSFQVVRLCLKHLDVRCRRHFQPRLLARHPKVRNRSQHRRIIKRAALQCHNLRRPRRLVIDPRAARRTEPTVRPAAAICRPLISGNRSLNDKIIGLHRHRDRKGRRRLFLALKAMTRISRQTLNGELIPNRTTLTSATTVGHGAGLVGGLKRSNGTTATGVNSTRKSG
ncbi:MAG: hypothetical protein ACI9XZ_000463 [Alphaproteobacteria bacterium]